MGMNQRAQISMSADEVRGFLERSRIATLATVGPSGVPHLVAMWYGFMDGILYFETKGKSQKAVNIRRNPVISVLIEAGSTYDQLRGVAMEGSAHIIENPDDDEYWRAAVNFYERYNEPYSEEVRPAVEAMMHKRLIVRLDVTRTRSWDHRKLQLPERAIAGSTAAFIEQ